MSDGKTTIAIPWEQHRAQLYQEAVAAATETKLDEAPDGGRSLMADGTTVDADGKVVAGKDKGAFVGTRGTHADLAPPVTEVVPVFFAQNEGQAVDEATAKRADRLRADGGVFANAKTGTNTAPVTVKER